MSALAKYAGLNAPDAAYDASVLRAPRGAVGFRFGAGSMKQRATLHPELVVILDHALAAGIIDFAIIEGHRGRAAQNAAADRGLSQVRWPKGKHNQLPSMAADLAPYPIDWSSASKATERFVLLAGVVLATAVRLYRDGRVRHLVRWGGDWNRDGDTRDESFRDYGHVELVAP